MKIAYICVYLHPHVHTVYAYMMYICPDVTYVCIYAYIHTHMTYICVYVHVISHTRRTFTQMEFVNVTPRIRTHARPRTCKNSEMNSANRTHTPSQSRTQQKKRKKKREKKDRSTVHLLIPCPKPTRVFVICIFCIY